LKTSLPQLSDARAHRSAPRIPNFIYLHPDSFVDAFLTAEFDINVSTAIFLLQKAAACFLPQSGSSGRNRGEGQQFSSENRASQNKVHG
jgi:hypothetical protein